MLVTTSLARGRARGFTLIELLITLVIVSVGLLGVAKLQAAAVAESGVARTRSLMTFQAEALAAAMRGNKGFWQSSTAFTQNFTIPAGGPFSPPSTMTQPATSDQTCNLTVACTPSNLAYDDMRTWALSFNQQFPTATANVTCNGSATIPETCDITLTWTEHSVAINRTTAAGSTTNTSNVILHVQP